MVSPEATIREPLPIRVRNIFIWATVVFWASSRMMKASLRVRPAHVGQRDDLNQVLLAIADDLLVVHHFVQGVHQRPQVGIDFGLQVARQEAEAFARLDRRPDEHQLADLFRPQRRHGSRHGQVGLAGARRALAEHHLVLGDGLDISGLSLGAGVDLPAAGKDLQGLGHRGVFTLLDAGQQAADILGGNVAVPLRLGMEFLQDVGRVRDGPFLALHVNLAVVRRDGDRQGLADSAHVLIARAEER